MSNLISCLFFISLFLLGSPSLNGQPPYPIPYPEGYVCYQTTTPIQIDGKIDEPAWQAAAWTNDFVDIEGSLKPAPYLRTRVKMLWDSSYWYFAAELEEPHLWATLKQRDTVIFYDNDFEIFIDPDGDTHGYYELELNAFNTVWDLLLPHPYREGGPAIDHWNIGGLKTAVELYGTLNDPSDQDEKWTVEVAIPWDALSEYSAHPKRLLPEAGEQWRLSFSRVHYDLDIVNGSYQKQKRPEYNWTWTPQWVINMHRPETWGFVQFETAEVGTEDIPLRTDPDFELKMALYEIYVIQRAHFKKHGTFIHQLDQLELSEYNKRRYFSNIQFESLPIKYLLRIKGQQGWLELDETGRFKLYPY
jgi:hypothetical protein